MNNQSIDYERRRTVSAAVHKKKEKGDSSGVAQRPQCGCGEGGGGFAHGKGKRAEI